MGRNSKYKSTRAVATAQSTTPKLKPENFWQLPIEENNQVWKTVENTRNYLIEANKKILSNPDNYLPQYAPDGLVANIEDITNGRPHHFMVNKQISSVVEMLQKTGYQNLVENIDTYNGRSESIAKDLIKGINTQRQGRFFVRTPDWRESNSNSPEYKEFYKGTKDVGDRIIRYVNKRCSLLPPEENAIKDLYLLESLRGVMVESINELNKYPLPWNRSYKYNPNQKITSNISDFEKYASKNLIGADKKVIDKLNIPKEQKDGFLKLYNNTKNAIINEIKTQQQLSEIAQNAAKQSVIDNSRYFRNFSISSEKDVKRLYEEAKAFQNNLE